MSDYRLALWLMRNLEKEQLICGEEIKQIWQEFLEQFDPPAKTLPIGNYLTVRKRRFLEK